MYLGSTLSGHLSSFMVKCARRSDGRGLFILFVCLRFLIYLFIYLFVFILKKEGSRKGSRRGSKKGSKKGVQKGGSTFCLHPSRVDNGVGTVEASKFSRQSLQCLKILYRHLKYKILVGVCIHALIYQFKM